MSPPGPTKKSSDCNREETEEAIGETAALMDCNREETEEAIGESGAELIVFTPDVVTESTTNDDSSSSGGCVEVEQANGETTEVIALTPDATAFAINQATAGADALIDTLSMTLLIKHRLTFELYGVVMLCLKQLVATPF